MFFVFYIGFCLVLGNPETLIKKTNRVGQIEGEWFYRFSERHGLEISTWRVSVVSDDEWRWLAPPSGDDELKCPFYLPWNKPARKIKNDVENQRLSRKMISKWWVLHIYVRFPESTLDIIWFNLGEWWFKGEYVSPFLSRNLFHNMCNLSVSGYLNLASAHRCKIQRPQHDLITTGRPHLKCWLGKSWEIILCPEMYDVYWCVLIHMHLHSRDCFWSFEVDLSIVQAFKP